MRRQGREGGNWTGPRIFQRTRQTRRTSKVKRTIKTRRVPPLRNRLESSSFPRRPSVFLRALSSNQMIAGGRRPFMQHLGENHSLSAPGNVEAALWNDVTHTTHSTPSKWATIALARLAPGTEQNAETFSSLRQKKEKKKHGLPRPV